MMGAGLDRGNDLESKLRVYKEKLDIYERIFDNIYSGVIITDEKGHITFFSKTYADLLGGLDPAEWLGRRSTDVLENSRMHIVAEKGVPEINQPVRIRGQDMVVQRIPIKRDGKVIAVFGQVMFRDMRDMRRLLEKLDIYESKIELYEKELLSLRSSRYTFRNIVGESRAMADAMEGAKRAAATDSPVCITGESGTGKELFAHAIHNASHRSAYPFITINCAAIPKDLLETELFGYEPGAFTGAGARGKPGKFELAHRGSVFLDEIGDLPLEMQPKLLRVIEDKEVERLGATKPVKSDFRLIAATNRDLEEAVDLNQFREDLFYRLNVIPLYPPPLRQMREDIPQLAYHSLFELNQKLRKRVQEISPEVMNAFLNYPWPGNVRELLNVLERCLHFVDGKVIELEHLPLSLRDIIPEHQSHRLTILKRTVAEAEKKAIKQALKTAKYNRSHAARLLGIDRTLLYKKLKKYNVRLSRV